MEFQCSQQSGAADIKTVGGEGGSVRKTYWKELKGKERFYRNGFKNSKWLNYKI
jgi:hypothetical protein